MKWMGASRVLRAAPPPLLSMLAAWCMGEGGGRCDYLSKVTVWDEEVVNFAYNNYGNVKSNLEFWQERRKTRATATATSKPRHCNHTHQPIFTPMAMTTLH